MANMQNEPVMSGWGVQQVFVRPGDGQEYQLAACQEATIAATATLAELMGDDSLVALDAQPKKKAMSVKVKHGRMTAKLAQLLAGGAYTQQASSSLGAVVQESNGASLVNALSASVLNVGNLVTDTFTFQALSPTTYTVTPSSTGVPSAVQTVSSYPNTILIPGVTFTVNGTLSTGDIASFGTTNATDTLAVNVQAKNDFNAKVGVRCITENLPGQGQLEFLMPYCQSAGTSYPLKTKDWVIEDAEFTVLFNTTLAKSLIIRRYQRTN